MPSETFHVKMMALKQLITSDCIHHDKTSVMVFQLIMTTHDMLKQRDSGKQLDDIILDFSKAFLSQFEAVVDQLRGIGMFRSMAPLRSEIVGDLANRPTTSDGSPLDSFVDNNDLTTDLNDVAKLGTYCDHMTLQRTAELYDVQLVVLSSIGPLGTRVISPYDRL